MITESGGGLEHANSTRADDEPLAHAARARDYLGWLGLVSHEFFHAWNVKRLRPVELGPFDYERRGTTRPSLWIAEGFTDYYDDLMVRRAGPRRRARSTSSELGNVIRDLQTTPGRLAQSAVVLVVRRVDQAVPSRRELAEHRRSATTRRAASSPSCSTRTSAR